MLELYLRPVSPVCVEFALGRVVVGRVGLGRVGLGGAGLVRACMAGST